MASNILKVSRTWTQCLAALLCWHVLAILKNAAHTIMPKSLLCKCFFRSLIIRLSKNKRNENIDKNFAYVASTDWQQQQASVAQGIILVAVKRETWVQAQVGAEKDV